MFGIRPWEVERLRPDELAAMQASLTARVQEPEEPEEPVSMADALDEAPVFDEDALPDPFGTPPRGGP